MQLNAPGTNEALERYRESLRRLDGRRNELKRYDRRWNSLRVLLFLAMVGSLGLGYASESLSQLTAVGWGLLFAFLTTITLHQRLRDEVDDLRHRRSVLRRLIARLERRWDRLPLWKPDSQFLEDGSGRATTPASISDDLDVFGRGSLFQFVSMASTGPGQRTLASWIVGAAIAEVASQRSAAAEAWADNREQREQLYHFARRAASGTADPDHFLLWIRRPSWLAEHRVLAAWSYLSPLLMAALVAYLLVTGKSDASHTALFAMGVVIAINALISTFLLGEVHQIFAAAIAGRGDVDGYQHLFAMTQDLPDSTPLLARIRDVLAVSPTNASDAMVRLKRIAMATEIKQVALLFPVYLVLQMTGLWELHVLRRLERWQSRYRTSAADWFEALGELEAVGSIAALADEYPRWAKPTWLAARDDARLKADSLGHPLIADAVRVCNDVEIGPSGTLLLVTGSNMSGKSTLLRSVGLNVLLAGTGARVCAASMSLPSLELATSIRVRDNLGEGVSFYMAELQSLARVVKHAERVGNDLQSGSGNGARLLFLLDEILQGTNSRERQIAVAHVLRHLIGCRAIGAITTHDLELADDPQLKALAHTVHFRETITRLPDGTDTMTFDYRMHDGISPTTNALRLLELVGLGKAEVR
ncbi:MAG: MutS-related protein [Planctomycetaceae bacterium]